MAGLVRLHDPTVESDPTVAGGACVDPPAAAVEPSAAAPPTDDLELGFDGGEGFAREKARYAPPTVLPTTLTSDATLRRW